MNIMTIFSKPLTFVESLIRAAAIMLVLFMFTFWGSEINAAHKFFFLLGSTFTAWIIWMGTNKKW